MKRYRVTFRSTPPLGCMMKSTNVAASDSEHAIARAVRLLSAYYTHQVQTMQTSTVGGQPVRESGVVHLYATCAAYWAGHVAEAWHYEVLIDEPSDFDLAGLVRMGQIVAPIPPRP
ncbi:MAG: hypothetical protein IAE99_08030 [Rhodothermales bacterium]|nr:hypothetical protein [Rhodothermales bacterium]